MGAMWGLRRKKEVEGLEKGFDRLVGVAVEILKRGLKDTLE